LMGRKEKEVGGPKYGIVLIVGMAPWQGERFHKKPAPKCAARKVDRKPERREK